LLTFQSILQRESVPGWTDTFYAHPLIRSLARPGTNPPYIPAQNFGLVLFDMVMTAGTETSTIGWARVGLEQVKNRLLAVLPSG
jgi:hypothetical protein